MKVHLQIKSLVVVASLVALAGCGKAKEEDKKNNPLSPNSKVTETNITDRSSCVGELTDRGSIVRNPWINRRLLSQNIIAMDTFVFKGDKLTKRTVCTYDKTSVEATVVAEIGLSEKVNEFIIIKGAKATEYIKVGNNEYPCTAEIQRSEDPIKFQFEGECLHVIPNAESVISYPPGFW